MSSMLSRIEVGDWASPSPSMNTDHMGLSTLRVARSDEPAVAGLPSPTDGPDQADLGWTW